MVIKDGRLVLMKLSSLRMKGLAEVKRVSRYSLEVDMVWCEMKDE